MRVKRVAEKLTHRDVDLGIECGETLEVGEGDGRAALRSRAYVRVTLESAPKPKLKKPAPRAASKGVTDNGR